MVMRMALGNATVTAPGEGETWEKVQVETRGTELRVRRKTGEQLVTATASAVRRVDGTTYHIDTDQGTFTVKKAGCGCGGGR